MYIVLHIFVQSNFSKRNCTTNTMPNINANTSKLYLLFICEINTTMLVIVYVPFVSLRLV